MLYKFRWRRKMLWKSIKVAGHRYEKEQDKMILFLPDGSLREISEWGKCEAYLKQDWVLALKKKMEADSGLTIPVSL